MFEELSDMAKIAQLIAYPLVIDQELAQELSGQEVCLECGQSTQLEKIKRVKPGIITIFGTDIATNSAELTIDQIKESSVSGSIDPLLAVDHEGGGVQRLSGSGFTQLPDWSSVCQLDFPEQKAMLEKSARELASIDINIVFAPVLDIARPGSYLGDRACADEDQAKQAAQTYIESFGKYRIMSVVKHFPGIGQANQDLHLSSESIALEPKDTQIFQSILEQYPNIGVMATHVKLEGKLDGQPCSLSSTCLSKFDQVFSDVIVFTDALNMESALEGEGERLSLSQAAQQALLAGNHILVFGKETDAAQIAKVLKDLTDKYRTDKSFQKLIDEKVKRILRLKLRAN
jgi:beta-N-acetylhexosaminidase